MPNQATIAMVRQAKKNDTKDRIGHDAIDLLYLTKGCLPNMKQPDGVMVTAEIQDGESLEEITVSLRDITGAGKTFTLEYLISLARLGARE